MKTALIIFTALVLSVLAGCEGAERAAEKELALEEKKLLTVDFQKDQSLRYRFVSKRDVEIDWEPAKKRSKKRREHIDKSSESTNIVVSYTPIQVDPNGLTTIKATCESVKINRSSRKGQRVTKRDAVQNLSGKTFTFTVSPSGKIEDNSQLDSLIRKIGKKAFRADTKRGKIKDPDMITDFIATQWFLWDSVSSREKADEEFSVGQTWKSKLSVPNPMVIRKARDVTYTLDEIRPTEKGRLAVIKSSYSLTTSIPRTWPNPYAGAGLFQMSGTFGFLRKYKVLDLQGQGEELFNIDTGRTEQYNQNYQMQLNASLPMGISTKPRITVQQKLTMQLLPKKQKRTGAKKQK
ncbi:MAG: hypothetical protein ACYS0C_03540 [Planctomycetota bacterium]